MGQTGHYYLGLTSVVVIRYNMLNDVLHCDLYTFLATVHINVE